MSRSMKTLAKWAARLVLAAGALFLLYGLGYAWQWDANADAWPWFDEGDDITVLAIFGAVVSWFAAAAAAVYAVVLLWRVATMGGGS